MYGPSTEGKASTSKFFGDLVVSYHYHT
jgi:hypothetical protein